jgi:hypothetical protein
MSSTNPSTDTPYDPARDRRIPANDTSSFDEISGSHVYVVSRVVGSTIYLLDPLEAGHPEIAVDAQRLFNGFTARLTFCGVL